MPHLRKGDDSPLRIWLLHWIRNACHTQRLPTPRRRRYGHNVTSPTRLRHSTAEWFTRSLRLCSRDARCVRAISRGTCVEICDAVRVSNPKHSHAYQGPTIHPPAKMNSNGNNGNFIATYSPFINKFTPDKITPIQNMMLKSKEYPRPPIIGPD